MLGTLIKSTVPRCLRASSQRVHVLSGSCCSLVVPAVAAGPWAAARQSLRCYSSAEADTSAPATAPPAPKKYNLRPINKGVLQRQCRSAASGHSSAQPAVTT
jgi:hypothetical protein